MISSSSAYATKLAACSSAAVKISLRGTAGTAAGERSSAAPGVERECVHSGVSADLR
ncbi:uncharacterized protein PHACADRAFT_257464 [Phanerochaete carnosa HHB-10118-sp]|uniref:Uncharacterized protein n=1 Tax=Phanerochaete carnosa (strain HHB-10118-sp) TaxID=650164 RepID=K5WU39_PHACS|nr:uncharacterized protein PHACADRAFT_257464 [Phanerochaete carnosa HHB-10118-sp]EKM53952.1 hypothetical protein PHACADRAFT_257464 [Phanerochaete carnosa HHB-10118-sp]